MSQFLEYLCAARFNSSEARATITGELKNDNWRVRLLEIRTEYDWAEFVRRNDNKFSALSPLPYSS